MQRSLGLRLEVSDEAYAWLKRRIGGFLQQQSCYRYTRLGVLLCLLGLPLHRRYHYFCSHFVAESLQSSGAVPLARDAALYLPNQLPAVLGPLPQCRQILPGPV